MSGTRVSGGGRSCQSTASVVCWKDLSITVGEKKTTKCMKATGMRPKVLNERWVQGQTRQKRRLVKAVQNIFINKVMEASSSKLAYIVNVNKQEMILR